MYVFTSNDFTGKLIIEKENGKTPSVLCVICGLSNAAYKRPDGVFVVPITALKN